MRFISLLGALLLLPDSAAAHAFGVQFTLPLPVNYYIFGGLAAFVASSAILLFFSSPVTGDVIYRRTIRLPSLTIARTVLGVLGAVTLVLGILVGFFGAGSFESNPLPNLFWIIFLLLFAYTTVIIGGLWPLLDPLRSVALLLAPKEGRAIPDWLYFAPSVLLFSLLWLELFSGGAGSIPAVLSIVLISYVILGIIMSRIYGTEAWFRHGDLFSTFFATLSRAAPLQIKDDRLEVEPPGERLVHERAPHPAILLFVFILLGSSILDGLRETQIWWDLGFAINPSYRFVSGQMSLIALFLIPYLLLNLYSLAIYCMKKITASALSLEELGLRFAYSLIPIAIAYHFAHYFSLILSQGQIFIAQISDPLAKGWDLFGTAAYSMNPGLLGADTVWYTQLFVIVGGHILAAIVAHRVSRRIFSSTRQVILSQLPMLFLMVLFTAFGLWTLAQPFVN